MNESLMGRSVAHYRVERLLGRGGMASIYFAWDTRGNRPVALKVLDERSRAVTSAVTRFVQEAQTIARWNHPHIINVYDAGEDQGATLGTGRFGDRQLALGKGSFGCHRRSSSSSFFFALQADSPLSIQNRSSRMR